jgi:hypothetical protein
MRNSARYFVAQTRSLPFIDLAIALPAACVVFERRKAYARRHTESTWSEVSFLYGEFVVGGGSLIFGGAESVGEHVVNHREAALLLESIGSSPLLWSDCDRMGARVGWFRNVRPGECGDLVDDRR